MLEIMTSTGGISPAETTFRTVNNRDFARDVGGSNENEAAAMLVYRNTTKMAESRTENKRLNAEFTPNLIGSRKQ